MTALYSPLGHTHRCGICERLYTCSKRHASAKTQYRCEDCGKRSEDLRLPASIPSANLDGFYYGPPGNPLSTGRKRPLVTPVSSRIWVCPVCRSAFMHLRGFAIHRSKMHKGSAIVPTLIEEESQ